LELEGLKEYSVMSLATRKACWSAVFAVVSMGLGGAVTVAQEAAQGSNLKSFPTFLDRSALPALEAAQRAVGAAAGNSRIARDEVLLRAADEARRRGEEERLKAFAIRREAEALSQRFAAELPAAETAMGIAAVTKPTPANTVLATERARQAEAELQEARAALAKARAELEEATQRAKTAHGRRMIAASDPQSTADATPDKVAHGKSHRTKGAKQQQAREHTVATGAVQPSPQPASAAANGGEATAAVIPPTATASALENPISGLLSKVFGDDSSTPPAAAFTGQ
jgi:hypothetical protein